MEEYVVNQRIYRNQQEYYAVVRRGQITPKRGSKHEEMPSFNFHAVVLEVRIIAYKRNKQINKYIQLIRSKSEVIIEINKLQIAKKKKDKTTHMMNDDEMAEKEHGQISNENDYCPRNFINYRRR
ncbi:unnamed protein product [Wuchereria bancrofti]|uniref:Uncharacterized protein n=1 Tax=Wuchereria bancrofti TaxID=6293 RepID=A0A3P7DRR4_WUCBA|nr:unnamed protein product [Wuchereria bancrofti]